MKKELINHLSKFITSKRLDLFNRTLLERTRYLTVILEDIFQSHNASAVLRSCDCFGIQDVHIIENRNEYEINPEVALGASKWLNLHKYNELENNTLETIKKLKNQNYRIVATTPHTKDTSLVNFDLSKGKTALLFGTEMQGISDIAMKHADEFLKIDMFGFTESFNISVSAGICLQHLTYKLRSSDINYKLSEEEKLDLKLDWLKTSIRKSDILEKEFIKKFKG